jgi:predicted SnoaL-like aldol condensation-catalyzing enzyme
VKSGEMVESTAAKNKAMVLEAFDTLFNKRDYAAAERFWSPKYIQHSAHIAPGREGLFELTRNIPPTLKYEPGAIVAEGNFVIVHGRFSGFGAPVNWIAVDILRIEDGILVEHWDFAVANPIPSVAPVMTVSLPSSFLDIDFPCSCRVLTGFRALSHLYFGKVFPNMGAPLFDCSSVASSWKKEFSKRGEKPSTCHRVVTAKVSGKSVVQSDEPLLL